MQLSDSSLLRNQAYVDGEWIDADSGEIGGSRSQEFHVLAESGEDAIAWCDDDNFASNVETAATMPQEGSPDSPTHSSPRTGSTAPRSAWSDSTAR